MINNADDLYGWYHSTADRLDAVLAELGSAANLPYTVALNLYHPQGGTGGMTFAWVVGAVQREVAHGPRTR